MVLFFIVIVSSSCSKSNQIKNLELKRSGEFHLSLDSVTGFYAPFIQYRAVNETEVLSALNASAKTIYTYDLMTGSLVDTTSYELEGPNGVGKRVDCFYIKSPDSIFVLDGMTGRVSLLNRNGTLMNKYNLGPAGAMTGVPFPLGGTKSPLIVKNNGIIVAGMLVRIPNTNNLEKSLIRYDMSSEALTYHLPKPESSSKYHWGGPLMDFVYFDYAPNTQQFIVSHSNYDRLMLTDLENQTIEVKTPSQHFEKLKPFSTRMDARPQKGELFKYYQTSSMYYGVLYDSYRELYYRFVLRPNEMGYTPGVDNMKMSVIVLNDNNQLLGEFEFDKRVYDFRMVFVSEKGLNFASKEDFSNNEDVLTFHTFVIEP